MGGRTAEQREAEMKTEAETTPSNTSQGSLECAWRKSMRIFDASQCCVHLSFCRVLLPLSPSAVAAAPSSPMPLLPRLQHHHNKHKKAGRNRATVGPFSRAQRDGANVVHNRTPANALPNVKTTPFASLPPHFQSPTKAKIHLPPALSSKSMLH